MGKRLIKRHVSLDTNTARRETPTNYHCHRKTSTLQPPFSSYLFILDCNCPELLC